MDEKIGCKLAKMLKFLADVTIIHIFDKILHLYPKIYL